MYLYGFSQAELHHSTSAFQATAFEKSAMEIKLLNHPALKLL